MNASRNRCHVFCIAEFKRCYKRLKEAGLATKKFRVDSFDQWTTLVVSISEAVLYLNKVMKSRSCTDFFQLDNLISHHSERKALAMSHRLFVDVYSVKRFPKESLVHRCSFRVGNVLMIQCQMLSKVFVVDSKFRNFLFLLCIYTWSN